MKSFTERAITIIKDIPPGKVMTYGQIAGCAGSPRGARQVVRILHSMSRKHHLPWHRVISSKGKIGFQDEDQFHFQKKLLEGEGVVFVENRIELKDFQYSPVFPAEEYE
ncbi:MGMT family protein [Bacillus haikouensis]|uniref:MGMT family protein n=1 Tax=Bacillus haikouensis TaxID=1510468 RepID=UPI001554CAA4|nr:MGMT family protein [Bacillus haikouensis]NQD64505.1 MGMT family protein [Bacillus haikouensis]